MSIIVLIASNDQQANKDLLSLRESRVKEKVNIDSAAIFGALPKQSMSSLFAQKG